MKILRRRGPCGSFESLEQRLALAAPEGYFDAIDPGFIVAGWALDQDELPASISVQIRINGDLVDTISTGFPRPDLGREGNHGYRWQIPPQYLDGQEYTVRVAAVDPDGGPRVPLVGSPMTFQNTLPEGFFDAIDPGFVVSGWALDRDVVADPIAVQIRIDGEVVDTIMADADRQVLGLPGNHGFRWQIPDRFMDGQDHHVTTWAVDPAGGQAVQLGGGSKVFRNTVPEGYFDAIDPGFVVSGWAADQDSLGIATDVEIEIDGVKVATVAANLPRPDVLLSGNHGFRWEIPAGYLQGEERTIRTFAVDRRGGPRFELVGSPKTFRNTLPDGTYAGMESDFTLVGWAWDVDDPARSIPVEFHVDGQYFNTIIADVPRPDLGLVGNNGFRLQMPLALLDGNEHRVNMIALDPDGGPSREILNSPVIFKNQVPAGTVNEIGSDFVLSGWAQDPDAPGASIEVDILIDDHITERVVANLANPDGSGNHRFEWPIPDRLLDALDHELRVFGVDATRPEFKQELTNGPIRFRGGPEHNLYLAFDGGSATREDLQRFSSDWDYSPDQCIDQNRIGFAVEPLWFPSLPSTRIREEIIQKILDLVRNDLAPFGIGVHRYIGPVVENVGATTIFIGNSTSCHPHIAGDIDVGNDNLTDIAFVGVENWGSPDRTALALADVVLHEAGHTFGLFHVRSGSAPETMGLRYNNSSRDWVVDTSFLDQAFAVLDGHGPTGTQNSYQIMANTFGVVPANPVEITLDLSPPQGDFVPEFFRPYEYDVPGDANRDGFFDSADLILIFQAGEYEDGVAMNSSWETGDWNGDGEFDTGDLVYAFQFGAYVRA